MAYEDIIHLPYHPSKVHPQMSIHDRAAQFAPFAALTGFEDAVEEEGRLTQGQIELDEMELELLNLELNEIAEQIDRRPEVLLKYFVPDERKEGGSYPEIRGRVKKLDSFRRCICLEDGTVIALENLVRLERVQDPEENF